MKNIIEAIEAKLQAQKDEIFFNELQISELKKQISAAEIEIENMRNYAGGKPCGMAAEYETIIKNSSEDVVITDGKKYRLLIEDIEAGKELVECFTDSVTDETIFNILNTFDRDKGATE